MCEEMTDIRLGVKHNATWKEEREKEREKERGGERESEREALFTLFGNNHRVESVPTVNARWCPSPMCHVFETGRREEDQEWHAEQRSAA